ncbi:MAG TPA: hypothetical protein VGD80_39435, partial [Kofleriaceae bacterium]
MTTIRPVPVDRYLVPDRAPVALPGDAIRVRQALVRGMPTMFQLDAELSLVLYVPTGDALLWRDANGTAVIAAASEETGPRDPAAIEEAVARAPARLVLQRGGANVGAAALRVGPALCLPDDGASAPVVQLWI